GRLGGGGTGRGDDHNLTSNQIGCQCRQPVIVAFCPAILDRRVLPLDVAGFLQSLAKRGRAERIPLCRCAIEKSDHWHRWLLRASRERPCHRRAAEQADELAALHSITSSTRPIIGSGTVRPSALAVFMLMTSSTLVACWTGSSAGFSPLRIRPV